MNEMEESLIRNIKVNDIDGVKVFLLNNQEIKQVYDSKNASAAMISLTTILEIEMKLYDDNGEVDVDQFYELREKQIKIYEALVAHGFTLGPFEDGQLIEDQLDIRTRIKLRKIHKTLQDVSLPHLSALISMSKLAHHTPDDKRSAYNQIIARTFEELNAIKWIQPILKVAANSEDLKIIFDFHDDSIMNVDTTAGENVHGSVNSDEKVIVIGAAKLLLGPTRFEVLGHLAHEITHFAMQLVYQNNAKPYTASSDDQEKFERVAEACRVKGNSENYISTVYRSYTHRETHAELIVRVPHLLALYSQKEDRGRLENIKTTYSELFEFYETKTLVDVEREHPLMEARKKIIELNEFAGVASELKSSNNFLSEALKFEFDPEKVSLVRSNCTQLTMKMIHQQHATKKGSEFSFIFISHETLMNEKLSAMTMNAFNSAMKPTLAIDCGAAKVKELSKMTGALSKMNLNSRVVAIVSDKFVSRDDDVADFSVSHCWKDLTVEAQKSFLNTKVIFQGLEMPLNKIIPFDSAALHEVSLGQLLDRNMIKISKELKLSAAEFYIVRDFYATSNSEAQFKHKFNFSLNAIRSDEIVKVAETLKVLLLSSDPGMGKSTELKMMAKRLKNRHPSHWIVFVDLKQFVEAFEKDGKVTTAFESCDDIVKFFCQKILKIEGFEAAVFSELFRQNQVIFFLDGFDEISPSFKQFNISLAKAIKSTTENMLWVATRTHLEEELQLELNCIVYSLQWNYSDIQKWINEKSRGEGLTSDQLNAKYDSIVNMFDLSVYRASLRNKSPILMLMAFDLSREPHYDLIQANLYLVYKTYVHKVAMDYVRKGFEAVNDIVELIVTETDIIAFHQILAVKEILGKANAILLEPLHENEVEFPYEKMVRVGFVSLGDSNKLHFIQRTFAEFFVVDLIAKNIRNMDSSAQLDRGKALIEIFRKVWASDDDGLNVVRIFFDGFFETFILSNESQKVEIIRGIFEKNLSKAEIRSAFANCVKQGLYNTLQLIPVANDSVLDLNELWCSKIEADTTALSIAAAKQSVKFIERLVSLARTALDDEFFERIFFDVVKERQPEVMTILSLALKNKNSGVFSYFTKLPVFSMENPKAKKLFMDFCGTKSDQLNGKGNLLMHALMSEDDEDKQRFVEILVEFFDDDEVKCILKSMTGDGYTILFTIAAKFTRSSVDFLKFIKQMLTRDELRTLTLTRKYYDKTFALAVAVEYIEDDNYFQIMWNFLKESIGDEERFKQVLLDVTYEYRTILTYASLNANVVNYRFVLDVYKSHFDVSTMRQMLSKIDYTRNNWRFAAQTRDWNRANFDSCGVLWKYMQEILDHDTLSKLLPHFYPDDETDLTKISVEKAYRSTGPKNV